MFKIIVPNATISSSIEKNKHKLRTINKSKNVLADITKELGDTLHFHYEVFVLLLDQTTNKLKPHFWKMNEKLIR